MKTIIALCGPPCVGKTTLALKLKNEGCFIVEGVIIEEALSMLDEINADTIVFDGLLTNISQYRLIRQEIGIRHYLFVFGMILDDEKLIDRWVYQVRCPQCGLPGTSKRIAEPYCSRCHILMVKTGEDVDGFVARIQSYCNETVPMIKRAVNDRFGYQIDVVCENNPVSQVMEKIPGNVSCDIKTATMTEVTSYSLSNP